MGWFFIVVMLVLYTFACLFLIFVILVQSGKGGGLSSLGSASQGISDALGASGAERTLNKMTTWCAVGFMVLALALWFFGGKVIGSPKAGILKQSSVPAAPVTRTGPTLPAGSSAPVAPESKSSAPEAPAAPVGSPAFSSTTPKTSAPAAPAPPAADSKAPEAAPAKN
jgi:preprotein translocase subunit SecG